MTITFVGTSHGRPELNRGISGTLFEINGEYYIFDVGSLVNAHMINTGKDVRKIRGIFISHMHTDHICSLPAVIDDIDSYRKAYKEVSCYLPEDSSEDSLFAWFNALHMNTDVVRETFKFFTINAGEIYRDENITVIAKPTNHLSKIGFPAYAFEIHTEGKIVLFTGDMSVHFPEFKQLTEGKHYNLIISEMAHAKFENAAEILKTADTERMIINHIYPKQLIGGEDKLKSFPFDISLAEDGMEITL